ncbi:MAG: molecular chaperone DnaJ [Deltaproteobacteria bacterium SG8_13]|nr:MAG: molecular chaperone DnaJ [Deltaproteobacteria bacterium SG8_13]
MLPGFEKIVEQRIRDAQRNGEFENLEGTGKPLRLDDESNIPEDLRLAYKVLRNADMMPPELELRKEILRTEDLLEQMPDTAAKYRLLNKLNFMIMRVNTIRRGRIEFEMPQHYADKVLDRLSRPGKSINR